MLIGMLLPKDEFGLQVTDMLSHLQIISKAALHQRYKHTYKYYEMLSWTLRNLIRHKADWSVLL